ncbi:DUF2851 family protein [Flavilitoribacter nigricans]|uniref:DUF2851 family protein n=1 Tax=Flavilitoribacter nigricans (strain ATCC 23147 / DSM 23189 / NBRC 102662 / NCIMB 1420 / SS-2) TaxID=1122177 RepID=A0A2D0N3V7_FLAN2|nr:DUF2851 family protein [Flavilitoribacter nigricans]PHN03056.1 hypothetical protein CRP01_28665 [Flavilitoribacter nigricans DSM 23189 = NBRC 102662]
MQEDLLHFAWRLKRFDLSELHTTDGEPIEILHFGEANRHAGPDFLNARIRIGKTLWAGNVEMHLKASDWELHHHGADRNYDNVILHVVLEEDQLISRSSGEKIPCLELKKRIPNRVSRIYKSLLNNEYWIPCQHQFFHVNPAVKQFWLDRLLVERLEAKTDQMVDLLEQNQYDWELAFYQLLARNFGMRVNAEPFEQLARSLPLHLLQQYKDRLFRLEALLFGQAGMLEEELNDAYPRKLQQEYRFLRHKHQLQPIAGHQWKFLRMRPANFPTIRIAQLAMLLHQSAHLFSKMLAARDVKEIEHMFALKISNYWRDHYTFDKASRSRQKTLGKTAIHLLIINTIAPLLFLYGNWKKEEKFKDRALHLLEALPPEKNHIIEQWKTLGMSVDSAYASQALLQLKHRYCEKKNCLNCAIGNALLKA